VSSRLTALMSEAPVLPTVGPGIAENVCSPLYQVCLTRAADKAQKKWDKPLRRLLAQAIEGLALRPKQVGQRLSQPLVPMYSHHFTYQGAEYRIGYLVEEDVRMVMVLLIGPHENFYRKLKNVAYAS
jgi:mRNA interferase RelE/StbE